MSQDLSTDAKNPSKSAVGSSQRKVLGKGLDVLLGLSQSQSPKQPEPEAESAQFNRDRSIQGDQTVQELVTALIDPNPQQPRRYFKEAELQELADSISANGIIQPLIVCQSSTKGRYTLIAGERRLRAAIAAKLAKVPVIIRDSNSEDMLRLALLENIQRSDLNVIEEAFAYESLISQYGMTQEQCAAKLGKERSSVSNTLRMLQLPQVVQDDLIQERLSFGHAKAILSLDSEKQILDARNIILKGKLSVRQTEILCKKLKKPISEKKDNPANPNLDYIADSIRECLRTKVRFVGTGQRGKIEISYFSPSELERVLEIIGVKLT